MGEIYGFDGDHCKEYGMQEAVIIRYFKFWIEKNRANNTHYHEGRYWTYNSIRAFAEIFYYMSEKQIRTTLESLKKQGVIMTGRFNKTAYDQTIWYAFHDEDRFLGKRRTDLGKSILPNGQMETPERANLIAQKGEPIPVVLPFSNTDKIQNTGGGQIDQTAAAVAEPPTPPTVNSPISVMYDIWIKHFPDYKHKASLLDDNPALRKLSNRIFGVEPSVVPPEKLKKDFSRFCKAVSQTWLKGKSLKIVSNNHQEAMAAMNDPQTPESIKIKLDAHKPPVMHNNQQPRIVLR